MIIVFLNIVILTFIAPKLSAKVVYKELFFLSITPVKNQTSVLD